MPVNMQLNAHEYSFDDSPAPGGEGESNTDTGVAADTNTNNPPAPQPVIDPIETVTISDSETSSANALPDPMLRFGATEFVARGGVIAYPPSPPPAVETAAPTAATSPENPASNAISLAKDAANANVPTTQRGTKLPPRDSAVFAFAREYAAEHSFDAEQVDQVAAILAYYGCETQQQCKDTLESLTFHISSIMQSIGWNSEGFYNVGFALSNMQEAQAMMSGDPNAGNRYQPDGRADRGVDLMGVQMVGTTRGSARAGAGQGDQDYANEMAMATSSSDTNYYDLGNDFSGESCDPNAYDTASTPQPNFDPLPSLPPAESNGPIMLPPPELRVDQEHVPIPAISVVEETNSETLIANMPDAQIESAANARATNDLGSANPPLTLNLETGQYGRDYGNGVWSYPLQTPQIESNSLPAINNTDTIREDPGLIANLTSIYQAYQQGQISLSDALSMARGNIGFSASSTNTEYAITTRLGGAAQAAGGFVEGLVGLGLSETGIGAVIGVPIALHGVDNMFAGERTMVEGRHVPPLTVEALEYAGMSPMAAELTNAGLGLAGTVGPGAVNSVVAGRAAQGAIEAEAMLNAEANLSRVGGAGGNWQVANEVSDASVVQQANPNNCGPACAEMMLSDRGIGATQGEIGDGLTSARSLADGLNSVDSGWIGSGVDNSSFDALNRTGSWSAMMWDGGRVGHWVVVDGVNDAGMVMIRDPLGGTRYEMTRTDFLNTWSEYCVYKQK